MSGILSRDLPGSGSMDIEDEAMQTELQLSRLIEHCILAERRQQAETDDSALEVESAPDTSENLSKSLIATNLPRAVFQDLSLKNEFETLFLGFDSTATFHYLKSFRRARVDFTSSTAAGSARIYLHQSVFAGSPINVYFAQPIVLKSATAQQAYLQLPPPVRQFLISPPASPPVDWAPAPESEPVINYDLLAALSKLGPGEAHELHPPSESHPSIVVHVCAEEEIDDSLSGRARIVPTKCPERK